MSEGVLYVDDNGALTADALVGGASAPIVGMTRAGVRVLIFNRPAARNALTRQMRRDFAVALADANDSAAIHAVIVTGAGGAFCAGVDIKESRATPAPMVRPHPGEALRALRKPVITAVDGPCITGGLEIALSCSFIIASERAVFADTHAKVGVFPAWGMTALLPRAVGERRARQMMLSGMRVDARTAYAWGLVNEVVAQEQLLLRCFEMLAPAAEAATQLAAQLPLLNQACDLPLADALAAEAQAAEVWRAGKT